MVYSWYVYGITAIALNVLSGTCGLSLFHIPASMTRNLWSILGELWTKFGLGGTYRGLYRVLGGPIKRQTTNFVQGSGGACSKGEHTLF